MDQLSLFEETTCYQVRAWLGEETPKVTLVLPEGDTYQNAVDQAQGLAYLLTRARSDVQPVWFDEHITPDGRMYGMRGQERLVIEIVATPAYSYLQGL